MAMDDLSFAKMAQEYGLDAGDFSDSHIDDFSGPMHTNHPGLTQDMYDYTDSTDDISTYIYALRSHKI
jgi:hypothetical protein